MIDGNPVVLLRLLRGFSHVIRRRAHSPFTRRNNLDNATSHPPGLNLVHIAFKVVEIFRIGFEDRDAACGEGVVIGVQITLVNIRRNRRRLSKEVVWLYWNRLWRQRA